MAKKKRIIRREPFAEKMVKLLDVLKRHKRLCVTIGILIIILALFLALLSYHRHTEEERLQAHLLKGIRAYREGRFDEAEKAFGEVREGGLGRLALLYEARLRYQRGDKKGAREILERLRHDRNEVVRILADHMLRQGRF